MSSARDILARRSPAGAAKGATTPKPTRPAPKAEPTPAPKAAETEPVRLRVTGGAGASGKGGGKSAPATKATTSDEKPIKLRVEPTTTTEAAAPTSPVNRSLGPDVRRETRGTSASDEQPIAITVTETKTEPAPASEPAPIAITVTETKTEAAPASVPDPAPVPIPLVVKQPAPAAEGSRLFIDDPNNPNYGKWIEDPNDPNYIPPKFRGARAGELPAATFVVREQPRDLYTPGVVNEQQPYVAPSYGYTNELPRMYRVEPKGDVPVLLEEAKPPAAAPPQEGLSTGEKAGIVAGLLAAGWGIKKLFDRKRRRR